MNKFKKYPKLSGIKNMWIVSQLCEWADKCILKCELLHFKCLGLNMYEIQGTVSACAGMAISNDKNPGHQ
jgi:hypothetical protein